MDRQILGHPSQTEQETAAERRFRLVVEAAPNAMVMINPAGEIVMVNAQAERVFGYARAEILGQPVEMLVPERFRSHHPGLRATFFADPRPRPMGAGRDLYGRRKDGSEFPVEIGLNPIPNLIYATQPLRPGLVTWAYAFIARINKKRNPLYKLSFMLAQAGMKAYTHVYEQAPFREARPSPPNDGRRHFASGDDAIDRHQSDHTD
jgi:PAS domain S-box-containing protein